MTRSSWTAKGLSRDMCDAVVSSLGTVDEEEGGEEEEGEEVMVEVP
jgi:hypothetical protein